MYKLIQHTNTIQKRSLLTVPVGRDISTGDRLSTQGSQQCLTILSLARTWKSKSGNIAREAVTCIISLSFPRLPLIKVVVMSRELGRVGSCGLWLGNTFPAITLYQRRYWWGWNTNSYVSQRSSCFLNNSKLKSEVLLPDVILLSRVSFKNFILFYFIRKCVLS